MQNKTKSNNMGYKMKQSVSSVLKWCHRLRRRIICLSLLCAIIFIGWYYARITYYEIAAIDPRVTYTGSLLNFTYIYNPKNRPLYNTFDEAGFAIIKIENKFYRHPVSHCNIALHHYNRYLETGRVEEKIKFLKMAQLLLDEGVDLLITGQPCMVWHYHFASPWKRPHPVPWISCLAQGSAISVLCRAYQITQQKEFLDAAKLAIGPFKVDVEHGGLVAKDIQKNIYYEEYPFPGKTYHVLNGWLTSLFGLYDLYRITKSTEVKALFDQGVHTLRTEGVLDRYDLG